ncbi:metal ABC transporter ATP-binding protein [Salisediminibacterium selenitireducens]|uniref:ABC transporter related protein n=1 Tax=Bacillus selenitireducens (strain ATCC 700615 / DSM 15326 / MLS10) TaxID=439292 RepID=D6XW85_BACIE|nr:metal ABC transporter ATP-binding protein [Salisediminibacterium selenitireducens]ADH99839.1 ABC transporter related protein [[Bacillus] selenitireducens MLS10]
MNDSVIDVNHMTVHYHRNKAIEDVTFSMPGGQIIGVIGPNGAGKSTLMKAMLGLEKYKGQVSFFGQSIQQIRKEVAYVPQRSSIDWDFPVLVRDVVLMGRYMHIPWYGKVSKEDRNIAQEALMKTGMASFSDRQIGELSGGQQQRVFLARALAQKADIFFLDEPFVGIDMQSEEIIMSILRQLKSDGKTLFVIHHDLSKVEQYFDQLILLNRQLIRSGPVKDVYTPELLKKAYGGQAAVLPGNGNESFMVVSPS